MMSRRIRQFGAILGLFAILMVALAPSISQALTTRVHRDIYAGTYCTTHPSPVNRSEGAIDPHVAALHVQACDYCDLLTHLPALLGPSTEYFFAFGLDYPWTAFQWPAERGAMPSTLGRARAPPHNA